MGGLPKQESGYVISLFLNEIFNIKNELFMIWVEYAVVF